MKSKLDRLQLLWLLLTIMAAGGVYYGGYHFFVAPVKDEVSQLEHQLGIHEQAIAETANEESSDEPSSSTSAQHSLPVVKATDQILLAIKQAGDQSNSKINLLSLVETDGGTAGESNQADSLPEEVKAVNYYVEANTGSYEQLHAFLEGLQQMDRLIDFELVQFGRTSGDQIQLTVSFQAFYDPSLPALLQEVPEETYQQPAGKSSPF